VLTMRLIRFKLGLNVMSLFLLLLFKKVCLKIQSHCSSSNVF